jgi:hypothetical protein
MVAAWQLLVNAQPPAAPRPWADPRLLWTSLALAGLILLGALVIAWLKRWRRCSEPESLTANEQLARFRDLYETGDLSQAEFERIRAKLAVQLLQELGDSAKPAAPGVQHEPQPPRGAGSEQPPAR